MHTASEDASQLEPGTQLFIIRMDLDAANKVVFASTENLIRNIHWACRHCHEPQAIWSTYLNKYRNLSANQNGDDMTLVCHAGSLKKRVRG